MSRDFAITYGSFNVGGSSAPTRQIDGDVRRTLNTAFETTVVEFDFITTANSDSAFATEVQACENAFRIPRQDFTWTQAGQTLLSLKQSDNSGLDCNPTIEKTGDPADTGRSIKYHVRLEFGRPADNMTEGSIPKGLRFDTITVSYSPSRQRTVTIDGLFTAYSATGAYEQYLAQIAGYATTALNKIDNTASWEKIGEPKVDQNISDKFSNFTVIFKEVIYNQGANTLDVPELIDPTLIIDVERFSWDSSDASGFTTSGGTSGVSGLSPYSGSSPTVVSTTTNSSSTTSNERPWIVNLSYTVAVDKTVTKDLVTEYKTVVRPLLIQAAKNEASGASLILLEDKPEYDPYYNRINCTMQFIAYNNNQIERHVTISDRTNTGLVLHGLWTSNPFDYYEHQGQAVRIRTILEENVAVDTSWNGVVMQMIESLWDGGATTCSLGDNWRVISREPKGTDINRGISDGGSTIYIASWAIETTCQYGNFRSPNTTTAGTVNGGVAT